MMTIKGLSYSAVSIHAPARGATQRSGNLDQQLSVSIHAPARGATLILYRYADFLHSFNPRTREGCDEPMLSTWQE